MKKNNHETISRIKPTVRKDGLTQEEGKVMDALVEAVDAFNKLEATHPCDKEEFGSGIHQCQKTLTMRILRRDYPEGYPTY